MYRQKPLISVKGRIQTYMNYIDRHIKTNSEDKTIEIIICKQENKYVIK